MSELVQAISNVGFPIVMCVFMMLNNQKFVQAINELTVTLKEISTRIENLEDEVKGVK